MHPKNAGTPSGNLENGEIQQPSYQEDDSKIISTLLAPEAQYSFQVSKKNIKIDQKNAVSWRFSSDLIGSES